MSRVSSKLSCTEAVCRYRWAEAAEPSVPRCPRCGSFWVVSAPHAARGADDRSPAARTNGFPRRALADRVPFTAR